VLHRLAPSTNHAHHLFLCIASVTSNTHLKECFIRHALHVYLLGLHVYLLAVEASLTSRVNVVLDVTCAPLCIVSRAQRVERMGLECRSARLKRVVCCRVPRVERGVTSFMPAFMPAYLCTHQLPKVRTALVPVHPVCLCVSTIPGECNNRYGWNGNIRLHHIMC